MADEPFIVISDESGTDQRIQSLAFVSGPRGSIRSLNNQVKEVLASHNVSELKFKDIDDARKNRASHEVVRQVMALPEIRVLVLTWDMQDDRHTVEHRDTNANFHRMVFHGLRQNAEWHGRTHWDWYPDQKTDLDHESIQSYLNCTREDKAYLRYSRLFEVHREYLSFRKVEQVCSKKVPIIGIADLFAGMVRHSIIEGDKCILALQERHTQNNPSLLDEFQSPPDLGTRAPAAKARFIADFYTLCASHRLGVSLKSERRLTTFNRRSKFVFWHYEPQGDYDKAPRKTRRTPKS